MTVTPSDAFRSAATQQQFLTVISRDEAEARFQQALPEQSLGGESSSVANAAGRVLAEAIMARIDVPGFDRSNVDGFAVRAADTAGAMEESLRTLKLNCESLVPGVVARMTVAPGTATPISTGGMVPRGADAILMIEDSNLRLDGNEYVVDVSRAIPPGAMITFAGSDISRGETVLWPGQLLTSRELGVLAALGVTDVQVRRRPQVAIISTGDEVVAPGHPLPLGSVYDSNAVILSEAVRESGGDPVVLGSVGDNERALREIVTQGLTYDLVLLSGGTSKGPGDLSYRVVSEWNDPGIVAHGVALKPGKPICLAVTQGKPVVILPGFPTSAIFTFHEFVAPVIRQLAGLPAVRRPTVPARLPLRVNSDRGRTEYLLVRLFGSTESYSAYPLGKGSGAVTTFSQADGFITIPAQREIVEADELVEVTLLDARLAPADLVVIGSHCLGLDFLLGQLRAQGFHVTSMHVGSQGGVSAVDRSQCDLAGIHLLDPATDIYNRAFVPKQAELVTGYERMQCFICRADDPRFSDCTAGQAIKIALSDSNCVLVNRNTGSGTRLLLDQQLATCGHVGKPAGYGVQVKSHNAVAAAVQQGRADWGLAIDTVAREYGLLALPLKAEHYDFLIPHSRLHRPAVSAFRNLLQDPDIQRQLTALGFRVTSSERG